MGKTGSSMVKKLLSKLFSFFVRGDRNVIFFYTLSKFRHQRIYRYFRFLLWFYLLFLVIKFRFLKRAPQRCLPTDEQCLKYVADEKRLKQKIGRAEIVSFDVFDSLLFRKVSDPKDVFNIVGHKLGVINYKSKRVFAEQVARKKSESGEITLLQICKVVEDLYGIDASLAYSLELRTEKEVCVANQFYVDLFKAGVLRGKRLIAVSDMYLPSEFIRELLAASGFYIDEIFVSCECNCSKADGRLWKKIRGKFSMKKLVHIGDDCLADMKMCGKAGIDFFGIPNLSWLYQYYRECGIESSVMSLYGAQVNKLHTIQNGRSIFYEFGYIYGGILTYGFCRWLDQLALQNSYDLILFTARDSKVFFDVYARYFGQTKCKYLYISRFAALKISFEKNFDLYFDIMFRSKFKKEYKLTVGKTLRQAELEDLIVYLKEYNLDEKSKLDATTKERLFDFLLDNRFRIAQLYKKDRKAFSEYIDPMVKEAKKICVVDLGWRGTVYSLLADYFKERYPDLQLDGAMVGTNNTKGFYDLVETEKLCSYAFSHRHNISYIKDFKTMLLLELMYSNNTPSVTGYDIKDGAGVAVFGNPEETSGYSFDEMHQGIYDFCAEFDKNNKMFLAPEGISGAEAVAPINKICCTNQKYIKTLFKKVKYSLEVNSPPSRIIKQFKV